MSIYVHGASASQRIVIAEAVERVMAILPFEGEIVIRVDPLSDRPHWVEASAGEEVRIRTQIVRNDPIRTQYLLYEEVAHYILGKQGMPQRTDVICTIFQELFAGFVQWKLVLEHHPEIVPRMQTERMPRGAGPTELAPRIGRHIGMALAGRTDNDAALAEWIEEDSEDAGLHQFAATLRAEVEGITDPEALAAKLLALYRTARKEG